MIRKKQSPRNWKQEQLDYFRRYLNSLDIDSKEYNQILRGIEDLEKAL